MRISRAEEPNQSSRCPTAHRKWRRKSGLGKVPYLGRDRKGRFSMPNYSLYTLKSLKVAAGKEGIKGISRDSWNRIVFLKSPSSCLGNRQNESQDGQWPNDRASTVWSKCKSIVACTRADGGMGKAGCLESMQRME